MTTVCILVFKHRLNASERVTALEHEALSLSKEKGQFREQICNFSQYLVNGLLPEPEGYKHMCSVSSAAARIPAEVG